MCACVDSSPTILLGVSAAGVPVGGMTQEQALSALEENLGQVSNVALPLEYGPWEGEITAFAVRVDDQATVAQAWFAWGDTYALEVANDADALTALCVLLAIDCVNSDTTVAAGATAGTVAAHAAASHSDKN